MTRVCLGNIDYQNHTTNEGDELQRGMEHAGWKLCGFGFDGLTDVRAILSIYNPAAVFVSDKRDWDRTNAGCYRPEVSYQHIEALRRFSAFRIGVVKDAGSMVEYHQQFIEQDIDAHAVVTYYHDESVLGLSPFLERRPRLRTYHSIDAREAERAFERSRQRERKTAVVSGALNSVVYPLRQRIVTAARAGEILCDVVAHPGYGNARNHTPGYLAALAGYKVHLATASKFGFALRKIIESVAVGAVPITDLPAYDVLPAIDGALVRVKPDSSIDEIRAAIDSAAARWNVDESRYWAKKAWAFYDWRPIGLRLSGMVNTLMTGSE